MLPAPHSFASMNNPHPEPLSENELQYFKTLKDIKVVFDIGTRTSLDYLEIFPKAKYHLFEPYPPFYEYLIEATKDYPNVTIVPYGVSDKDEVQQYSVSRQAFEGGESPIDNPEGGLLHLISLDWYIRERKIKRIDFLKIDAEGYDFKILNGNPLAVSLARYIQYEHWDDTKEFEELLGDEFTMDYIGLRNVLCTRKQT